MDLLLSLLLQLQTAQLRLSQLQSARSARTEIRVARPVSTPTVAPVVAPSTPVAAAPKPAPAQTNTADVRSQIEQYVLAETNAIRNTYGLAPLTADAQTAAIARAHSADMIAQHYFEHTNLSGCNPGCRLTNAGYAWRTYGENIHWMSGYKFSAQESAHKVVTDWMNSPPHRANILGSFTYAGVGVAVSGDTIYTTTDYTTK